MSLILNNNIFDSGGDLVSLVGARFVTGGCRLNIASLFTNHGSPWLVLLFFFVL